MNTELTIKPENDIRLVVDEKGGRIILHTEPSVSAEFTLAYKDGKHCSEQLSYSGCERGRTCEVEITGPGITGIEIVFPRSSGGPFEPLVVKKAYVTIEAKASKGERWPETPEPGTKPTLKDEAEVAFALAVEIEAKQNNERVDNLFQQARDQILKAASAQTRQAYFDTFQVKEFELADDNKSQPILLGPGNVKSKVMKLLLERLNNEQITVKGTVYCSSNDKVKLELFF